MRSRVMDNRASNLAGRENQWGVQGQIEEGGSTSELKEQTQPETGRRAGDRSPQKRSKTQQGEEGEKRRSTVDLLARRGIDSPRKCCIKTRGRCVKSKIGKKGNKGRGKLFPESDVVRKNC